MAGSRAVGALGERASVSDRSFFERTYIGTWNFIRQRPLGAIGGVLVVGFLVLAIFAPLIAPYNYRQIDIQHPLEGPTAAHRLGTDAIGRDILSRLIYGARLSMLMGFGAVAISKTFSITIGLTSAYLGGWVDTIIQRFVDAWIAMPGLVVLITILGIARRTSTNLAVAMLVALALLRIAPQSRVIRSLVLDVRGRPYVEAAHASGASTLRIMLRHVLPNILPLLLITATVELPGIILSEASLSFLGFGPAGTPSWGQMLSTDGRQYFRVQPGLAVYPGVAIAFTVFGFNMFGDSLRDLLDPRLRGSR
ncbi:MAG: ABC transporter permease [Dehalococcoidia bacterium]|nr:ABC transporter permease [Dehalococcoidia bacterium]